MVIIDLNNKRVNQAMSDPDVVILKGASSDLINSLTRMTLTSGVQVIDTSKSHKVALGGRYTERVSKTVPQSVRASNDTFTQILERLTNMLEPSIKKTVAKAKQTVTKKACACSGEKVFNKSVKSRLKLQQEIADALVSNDAFIKDLRQGVEDSLFLNPHSNLPTINNVKVAAALYANFGEDRSFSSTSGATTISKSLSTSSDTIARLATDFSILRKTGASSSTRYFVQRGFANILIRALQQSKYRALLTTVDELQDQLDGLGSLK